MTFKQNWEKADEQHILPSELIEEMVKLGCPDKKLSSHEIISGGCANLNVKIQFESGPALLLRIYLRDKDAAYREQKIAMLLKQQVPVPQVKYIGDYQHYRFAITEFIEGITLRELLLSDRTYDISVIMNEVGVLLAKIASHHFPKSGFFDKNLNVIDNSAQDSYIEFAKDCLTNKIVLEQLNADTIAKINYYLDNHADLFPNENEKNLVHADFDPANILVNKINEHWKVTGILDWEFSFSGSVLQDVANMLRYAHQMPQQFEEAFLQGLNNGGVHLPDQWRSTVHLLNILSLLDLLIRSDPEVHSNRCSDIKSLISFILDQLNRLM